MTTSAPDHPTDALRPAAGRRAASRRRVALAALAVAGMAGLVDPHGRTGTAGPAALRARVAAAQDQTSEPPPAEPPAEPTAPPAEPTAAPPPAPTEPPAPPAARDDDDDDDAPAPPPPTETPVPGVVTRTPRPTRTPRTTPTVAPTPMSVGVLRMTIETAPRADPDDPRATVVVTLANRGVDPALGITLDIDTAAGFLLDRADAAAGQTARAGALVRWYLPQIDPGAAPVLRLTGTPAEVGGQPAVVCATLISAGSPIEHCAPVQAPAEDAGTRARAPSAATLPTAEPAGTLAAEAPGALRSGWTLFVLGLLALGVWGGLQWRSRGGAGPRRIEDRDGAA